MDILSGLTTVGSYMNSRIQPSHDKINTSRLKRTPIVGSNLYDNADYRDIKSFVDNKAFDRYQLANHPEKTGVIPNFYNQLQVVENRRKRQQDELKNRPTSCPTNKKNLVESFSADNDSIFSDDKSSCSYSKCNESRDASLNLDNDHMAFFKRGNMLQNQNYHVKKFINKTKEDEKGFLSQFEEMAFDNPNGPVSSNNTPKKTGKYSNISRIEMERELALKGNYSSFENNNDMTYGVVDEKNFVHNNMVPFFKSGVGKGYGQNSNVQKQFNDIKQRKMELFTGSTNSLNYRPKTERRPLFNPHVGLTWIYGTPNFTDYFESRFIPSRERRNELIHQPVRTTPGLNLGYNEVSKQGFHDTWRALPKNVDELRTANNPKISYGRPIIPGMKGERRTIVPNVAKRRPIKFKEQDPRDFVKSLGYYRAPSIYGNYEAPHTNRQMTTRAWYSPVGFLKDQPRPESMMEKFKIPFRENFKSDTPRNITGVEKEKNVAFDMQTNIPDPTLRDLTQKRTWNNPAGPEWQKTYAWDTKTNIPDTTLRDLTQKRTWNNPAGPEWQKTYAWDTKTNIPDPTLRDLTQKRTYYNPVAQYEAQKGGYQAEQGGTIAPTTLRQLTQKKTYYAPIAQHEAQKGGYQAEQSGVIVPTTLRQLTQKTTHYNGIAHHEAQKGGYQAEQSGTIAPTTLRQLTQNKTQYNPVALHEGQKGGYHAEQEGTIAPTTLRQLTQNKTQYNPVALHEGQKGGYHVEQDGTIAPTTLRQLTQNKTQYNPVALHEGQKGGYHVEQDGTIAPTTLRQLTQNKTQYNPVGHHEAQKGGYHAEQSGTVAPTTLRQLTQNKTQYNPVGLHEGQKGGYHAEQSGTVAPTTLRQLTQNKTYQGPLILHEGQKTRTRSDADNSLVNVGKETAVIVRDAGAPTTSNYEIGPTYDYTMVELCEPIQINRDVYGQAYGQRPLQCVASMHTRIANQLPQLSWRNVDPCLLSSLNSNPLINNLVHRSIEY